MFSLVMHLFGKEGKKDFVHNLDAKTFFQLLGRWSKKLIFHLILAALKCGQGLLPFRGRVQMIKYF